MEQQGRLTVLGKRSRDRFDNETWDEEKAFAEDAAAVGLLGGCVWPPRSYFCSFCNREFKSAQALGGHMNIHRRDRAKLKQVSTSSSINNNHIMLHPHPHPHPHPRNHTKISSYSMLSTTIKTHGEIDDFYFDFTNPNTNNNPTVFLSSVTTSVHQKMSRPTSQLSPSAELCHETNPSFSSDLKQKSGLTLNRVCELIEKEVVVEDDESDNRISEVNGIESCLINDIDLELRLGDRPKICKCAQTILTKSLC